jgi:ribosomal protein S18 acetylase RimI-like enzyme
LGAIAIREATEGDAAAVADLWTEAYVTLGVGGRADPYTEADFAASARRGRVFVADRAGTIAGVAALAGPGSPCVVVATAEEAELSRLAVAAPTRGLGTGRALVAHCERLARAEGWAAIALWSRPGQVEAHRLYESSGYRRLPERDSVDATGHGQLAFRLELKPAARMAP